MQSKTPKPRGNAPFADAAATPQAPANSLSAAFRSALGGPALLAHLDLAAAPKGAAGLSKAQRNETAAQKTMRAPKSVTPRSGHR